MEVLLDLVCSASDCWLLSGAVSSLGFCKFALTAGNRSVAANRTFRLDLDLSVHAQLLSTNPLHFHVIEAP
jgi:hypothetical protein